MAAIFNTVIGANGNAGNWVALAALPIGTDPMREVVVISSAPFMCGTCTAGFPADNSGFFLFDAGRHSLGVVCYDKITVRMAGTGTASVFTVSYSPMDNGPEGN